MDIFNGIRMRGGSKGRMAIARLDKVGLLLFSPVCFAFKDVAPCCGSVYHCTAPIRPDQFQLL
jgi:hypothetical protein